jgi:hypothetical protein
MNENLSLGRIAGIQVDSTSMGGVGGLLRFGG